MNQELFIYWRAPTVGAVLARRAAIGLQAALRQAHPGLVAGLLQRAEESGDSVTLMETYRLPGGIGPDLQARLVAAGDEALRGLCQGPRHVEVFEPVVLTGPRT